MACSESTSFVQSLNLNDARVIISLDMGRKNWSKDHGFTEQLATSIKYHHAMIVDSYARCKHCLRLP
jgi:hypothetical protein